MMAVNPASSPAFLNSRKLYILLRTRRTAEIPNSISRVRARYFGIWYLIWLNWRPWLKANTRGDSRVCCCPFKCVALSVMAANEKRKEREKEALKRDVNGPTERATERENISNANSVHAFAFLSISRATEAIMCVCVWCVQYFGRRPTSDTTIDSSRWFALNSYIFRVQTNVFTIQFNKWILIEWCTRAYAFISAVEWRREHEKKEARNKMWNLVC